MARDAELDRLKTAQDNAFQRKQNAYDAQQRAWEQRSQAREALNRAHEEKQRAYSAQDASWQDYQRIRSYNGPRIDQLNSQQESAFQDMKRAFDNASSAHERRDGAAASSYAADGHRYKAIAKDAVDERRRLVEEIRTARSQHEATKPAFHRAKDQFNDAKRAFDRAKAEHESKQSKFKQAKTDADHATKAFKDRLDKVRAESKRRKDDKRAIAEQAGVPSQYRDDVWISKDTDGNTNIYFGGVGKPNGPGHGHYVLDSNGKVTYKRDPFDPHGAKNFEDEGAYIARQRAKGHIGGFGLPASGFVDGHPVTFALGWGTKQGHTLLSSGHLSPEEFLQHRGHDHYGPGEGPHNNGTLRGAYKGPGA